MLQLQFSEKGNSDNLLFKIKITFLFLRAVLKFCSTNDS